MTIQRSQRSIRFSDGEWDAVVQAAERKDMTPAVFVREAAAYAAAQELDLGEQRLTPELTEIIKRTFRGVHLLAYLKREELDAADKGEDFRRAAEAAQTAQAKTFGPDRLDTDLSAESPAASLRGS